MFIVIVAVFSATWVSAVSQGNNQNLQALVDEIAKERRQLTEKHEQMKAEHKQMNAEHKQMDAEHKQMDAEHKQMDTEHRKMTELFQDATTRLEEQHDTLKQLNDELHEKIAKLRQEMKNDKLQAHIQNVNLQEQITKLHREDLVLRRADSEIKQTIRQRDQAQDASQEQDHTELKKIVASEIKNYLINERICVGGAINSTVWPDNRKKSKSNRQVQEMDYEVEFGYSFPRPPTVLASITALNNGRKKATDAQVYVKSVSDTSAVLHLARWRKGGRGTQCSFGWLACL